MSQISLEDEHLRKAILFLLILFLAYTMITRFVMIDHDEAIGSAPPYPCAAEINEARPGEQYYPCQTLEAINQTYLTEIKPIFEAKCLMCHGAVKKVPLYSKIPPSSWLVEYDIKEAKEELNMLWDIPFHGEYGEKGQKKALEEIQEVVEEGTMPPLEYKIMHWKSELNKREREKIIFWVMNSIKKLDSVPSPPEAIETQPEDLLPTETLPTETQPADAETLPETQEQGSELSQQDAQDHIEATTGAETELETQSPQPAAPTEGDGSASDFL